MRTPERNPQRVVEVPETIFINTPDNDGRARMPVRATF
jgi:hypothetical protein